MRGIPVRIVQEEEPLKDRLLRRPGEPAIDRLFGGSQKTSHAISTTATIDGYRSNMANRTPRAGEHLLKPVRQLIESVNDTLKGQLDLELRGGRTIEGVTARVAQRLLAMTAAIWHNRATGQPLTRSLIAYDH